MTAGIQIVNENSVIQIDQDYKNLVMVAKGSVTTTGALPTTADISVTANNPVIAFVSSVPVCVTRMQSSGTSWIYRVATFGAAATVDYYVFDTPELVTVSDTFGIEVRKADGSLAWHSSMKTLKVVAFLEVPVPNVNDNDAGSDSVSLPGGKTYAIVPANQIFKSFTDLSIVQDPFLPPGYHNYDNWTYFSCVQSSTLELTTREISHTTFEDNVDPVNSQWGQAVALVIDVTYY
jgi:hypothetical protein